MLFNYNKGRSSEVPLAMLLNFKGILQTDGLEQYQRVGRKLPNIKLAGCMAHARRKFHDALLYNEEQATWMIEKYQELYAIEALACIFHTNLTHPFQSNLTHLFQFYLTHPILGDLNLDCLL